jgi:hypothetical protein
MRGSAYSFCVADSLPPVAIRVARPFATEDELLENELETFTRTSITLLGAQPRPPGLVLRFELVLSLGQVLVRGEGRVVAYRPDAYYGTGGLTLRFTRLDSRSKAFVDKAAAMRERRRPSSANALGDTPSSPSLLPQPIPVDDPLDEITQAQLPARAVSAAPPSSPASRDRDALLDRLRARSKALDGDTVRKILGS